MAKLNASESNIQDAKAMLSAALGVDEFKSVSHLFESSEMGMRSFRVLSSIRPLVASVWAGMVAKADPNRFALESMLRDIDEIIGYWVVPDEEEESLSEEK